MEKFIVNSKMPGFKSVVIESNELVNPGDILVIIADDNINNQLSEYYTRTKEILAKGLRVVLLGVGEKCNTFFPLASLMMCYNAYDIYMLQSLDILSISYMDKLLNRKPTFEEVQSFIDPRVTNISDLDTLIIGIESLVSENNTDGLKVFLEQHMPSIENMLVTVEYLKKQAELTNSKELVNKLSSLKADMESLESKLDETKEKASKLREDKFALNSELSECKKEIDKLRAIAKEAESASGGPATIKAYPEIKTSLVNCKTQTIMYFKEVSYIPYMNSFIIALIELLKTKKDANGNTRRVKLLVYDSSTEIFNCYSTMNKVSSEEYVNNKDNYVAKSEKFVITDPNPVILTDILQYEPGYDVVIVYDRMHKLTDIVSGNNVYKFFVMNSLSDYTNSKDILHIANSQRIFTRPDVAIDTPFKIPRIPGFDANNVTASKRTVLYNKLKTMNNENLMGKLFEEARLNSNISKR